MCCDFFYPRLGGVEMHIFQLSYCLRQLGHKVVVITHAYGDRQGVRYITGGIKCYYLPIQVLTDESTYPNYLFSLPVVRKILIREQIDIVHSHQSTAQLGGECLLHAKTMGFKAVYTDHSLFGFDDLACINLNKLIKFNLSDIDHAISVSHTSRENLTLRAFLHPQMISVIPNAVDCTRFTPDPSRRYPLSTINIVAISRLAFRKGTDFLIDVIPEICRKHPNVYFIIGGDGPKKPVLEQHIKKHQLEERVELLGSVPHNQVRNVMTRGHIFLNTSLTEAFCIAIVEAASTGLFVVATDVGGVTEVLPHDMVLLAEPNPQDIIRKLDEAIPRAKNIPTQQFHQRVSQMYNWQNVAQRTQKVYYKVLAQPSATLYQRIHRYLSCGKIAGFVSLILVFLDLFMYILISIIQPAHKIELAQDIDMDMWEDQKDQLDHGFTI